MKTRMLIAGLTLALTGIVQAGLYYDGTGGFIPDNSLAGATRKITSTDNWSITDVSVVFNIKGGWNGDLYGYLTYNDGSSEKTQILLNHIGGGAAAAGSGFGTGQATLNYNDLLTKGVRLVDNGGLGSIDNATPGAGNPMAVGNYTPDSTVTFATTFGGMSGSGTWTLFFADTSAGDQSELVSWGLEVTAVPEPVPVALAIFAGVFVVSAISRSRHVRGFLRARCGASTTGSSPSGS